MTNATLFEEGCGKKSKMLGNLERMVGCDEPSFTIKT
uniref:Uncharacterized protein n=1 Tax=viral metagenome TaxID=1070528 RepID=A0A6C0BQI7_9ZZZZ